MTCVRQGHPAELKDENGIFVGVTITRSGFYPRVGKRLLDIGLALPLVILATPGFVLIAVMICLDSRGPVLWIQSRLGRDGRLFRVLKFRTMTHRLDRVPRQVFGRDPEVTRCGYWLRRFKIDELPQLVNVLRGDMSLVGPRPALPEQLNDYNQFSLQRLEVRPGMTGLAQVYGNIHLSWPQRWRFDRLYCRRVSLGLDLWILVRTVVVIFLGERRFHRVIPVASTSRAARANPRIVLAGSVTSSRLTLEALVDHQADVVGVLGLAPAAAAGMSGYVRLADLAERTGVPCVEFSTINDPEIVEQVRAWAPDLLFVVGLSQMVMTPLLDLPRLATIGYHPTPLPAGRGRAPLAWLTLDGTDGAATFFEMTSQADAGALLAQEGFEVSPGDYVGDVQQAQFAAIRRALEAWLPRLLAGDWEPRLQDERRATWNGRRSPADGLIDWKRPASEIESLVRAVSRPFPGAYTYAQGKKLMVWRAELEKERPIRGVTGRILENDADRGTLVQTGAGLLWLVEIGWSDGDEETENPRLPVGGRLGLAVEDSLARMAAQVEELHRRVIELEENRFLDVKRQDIPHARFGDRAAS